MELEIKYDYIYLIQEREFIKSSEEIYKIGRTCQADFKRFDGYPKNSHLLLFIDVPDCKCIEKILINKYKKEFKHRKDIGNEYFEGDKWKMMKEIVDVVQNFKPTGLDAEKVKLEKEKLELIKEKERLDKEREKMKIEKERFEKEQKKLENKNEKEKKPEKKTQVKKKPEKKTQVKKKPEKKTQVKKTKKKEIK